MKKFLELPDSTQHLLEFMSIIYAPISAAQLSKLSPVAMDVKVLRRLLDELVRLDFLKIVSNNYACVETLCDALTQRSLRAGRFAALAEVVNIHLSPEQPERYFGQKIWVDAAQALRDLRLQALLGNGRTLAVVLEHANRQCANSPKFQPHPWFTLWGKPLDPEWMPFIPETIFLQFIAPIYLKIADKDSENASPLWAHCQQLLQAEQMDTAALWTVFGGTYYWQLFQRQQWESPLVAEPSADAGVRLEYWHVFASARAFSQGKRDECIAIYQAGLKLTRKRQGSRKARFGTPLETFYVIALLLDGTEKSLKEAAAYFKEFSSNFAYNLLERFYTLRQAGNVPPVLGAARAYQLSPLTFLIALVVRHWVEQVAPVEWLDDAVKIHQQMDTIGYTWLANEYAAVLAQCLPAKDKRKPRYVDLSAAAHAKAGTQALISLYQPQAAWERSLQALQRIGTASASKNTTVKVGVERVLWALGKHKHPTQEITYSITPMLQKATKTGWSGGRNIAMKRLATEPETVSALSEEDRRICREITNDYYGYYAQSYELNINDVWAHLIGHPRVFWMDALNSPLDIQQGREELLILKEGGKLRIKLFPELPNGSGTHKPDSYFAVEETTLQLKLYKLTASVLQLHGILGKDGLLVPIEAEASVRQTLTALAPLITIQSDIAGMDNAETVAADPRLHIHLLPWGDGLRMLMRVQPFGDTGPIFPPGSGRSNAMTEVDRKLLKTTRNLKQERKQADSLLQDCPALAMWEDPSDDLMLDDPEQCLEALQQLHALGDKVTLAWPEGEKLRITQQVSGNNLSLKIKQSGDWFDIDGKLYVDENLVLTLRQLLDLSQAATGRFVQLADGQFLTLTRQFQKKLDTLRAYAETAGKNGLKVGALAGMALEDFIDEAGKLEADKHWKAQVIKLKNVRESQPVVPTNLQAELRDYQTDGFRWMMRLAEWGVGGCLADDMGLGKTVQTLGLLLARADKGAALVVAPVSVCNNWFSECQRFAPSLRPVFYRGKDRQAMLDDLQPHDLLIASYGLLQQDAEAFQRIRWTTIVLDEAQAIKNANTKRTQAAYQLQGDFRLVTTGTPIENHLGELWSLFRFLNPGLLFSQQKFGERFQTPIERDHDDKSRHALKKLVQPFMLRRTKNQVLQELPPRTEITLSVSLSDAEMALYEALRQQALERLTEETADGDNKHLQVLAEITRLRLAACHPQLAMPGSALPSSKLQAFGELVLELRENQHKALVFSQFVKHLTLLREWLDGQGIHYQYLDGSTPMEQRKERVDAFQRGEGDIFLISLKAGGFGLNLTAADYVIHMDPWWNPAVEDQASDRAHRIGQQRPVTVYRLVAENTIEEKIVKLHALKRDLADSLLEGSDASGKLSAKDMLEMIRGGV
ncbi:DEAD/DEAH box helicase [Thiothrix litoralis]|uniref:DEAD/DEAH box helicase n=2 Tax=Thiothrix litoralis TaxID=2891210 RepID=A0ABX7WX84_9GAMM|nr:DEAD/DEAH box helicase [Thiothrix litoralis]QTR48202.1 DEAD/DEAH box helicase [Thiothrix litoralis]